MGLTDGEVFVVLADPRVHTLAECPVVRRARAAGEAYIVDVDEAPGDRCSWCARRAE